ncbi:Thiaminase II [[Actinomadura] parvosata subsp. kistnae]|uniref:Aminopyrimidine aminohydrolase n=1 Tax=[Actinomadura] parvosata subsp. kistnae TaxID=1909395 RepID=A0A1V0AIE6_9ACTN|nr:TenA family protein [Nonomuraea sp. ATCC 55076]AQZ60123.1 TenA family transcriptional regulator [Nonomuraea sp. ATCC 55076]AQZ69990.1 TenA family transcriptional regulator [Nonomuraea sp. ATCC 55076]SPL90325.1 Thiaminase II [Actinomadura parvosata subsp. kistnae]
MSEQTFSEWLRQQCEPEWTAVVTHPFATAIIEGTAAGDAMRRYLEQDFQFVDSFTALLGAAVAAADTFEARVPYGTFLGQVATTEEKTYFHRALAELGGRTEVPLEPVTAAFRELMDEVRRSQDYLLIAAVLCVAEWCYLGWASRAAEPLPESFVHREWIELHEGAEFRAWVAFLRGELDRLGAGLGEERRREVLGVFRRAVELERAFFDMAAG